MLPGVVAVYGGMVLFVRVWFGLFQTLRVRPGVPIRQLACMLVLWLVPAHGGGAALQPRRLLLCRPGRDDEPQHQPVPLRAGHARLGSLRVGGRPLWLNTPAPYGPLFLMLAGWSASLSLHHALITVVLLRFESVAGVALIAYCIPKLARSFGRDPGPAFVLAVLNPLTLLALVGGRAQRRHHGRAAPGRHHRGPLRPPGVGHRPVRAGCLHQGAGGHRHRLRGLGLGRAVRRLAAPGPHAASRAALVTVAVMGSLSLVSGLGWGWIANLGTPGTVRSWMAPATGGGPPHQRDGARGGHRGRPGRRAHRSPGPSGWSPRPPIAV